MTAASTRLAVMMFLEYLIWGSWLPLLALYLSGVLGFTGGQIGWVAGRVFSDGRGWVEQLAVARSARGLGLGHALLLHSLAELRERGATSLALGSRFLGGRALTTLVIQTSSRASPASASSSSSSIPARPTNGRPSRSASCSA